MHTSLKIALSVAALASSLAATAAPQRVDTSVIDARQAKQSQRIDQALAHGQLDRREANILRVAQRDIRQAETRAKADGHVDRSELRRLTAMLDRADVQIREFRHDRRDGRPA